MAGGWPVVAAVGSRSEGCQGVAGGKGSAFLGGAELYLLDERVVLEMCSRWQWTCFNSSSLGVGRGDRAAGGR
ncbi:hypothetical protein E2562_036349 [Oryza meyeriana var. granulata]|uniref:Uncharacterized protein n=1 Tax=Oryza meyeriana var. granulata TaxID=110450 RepID=A0A6G1CBI6_9ORYZ|nr:hypothetical protein E2562_036349 [Oryza meyeriana var. granulata]